MAEKRPVTRKKPQSTPGSKTPPTPPRPDPGPLQPNIQGWEPEREIKQSRTHRHTTG
jgi:hypothetical protein